MTAVGWWSIVGSAASALGLVVPAAHRFVYKPIRRGVDGLMSMHAKVQAIDANLKPNSGESLFDQVTEGNRRLGTLERQQTVNSEAIQDIKEKTADTNETLKRQIGRTDQIFNLQSVPLFEMDVDGHLTRVNAKLEQQIGVANAELLGGGWLSAINMSQREPVVREIALAGKQRRAFRVSVTFEVGRRTVRAILFGQPTIDGAEVLAFQGSLEVLSVTEAPAA